MPVRPRPLGTALCAAAVLLAAASWWALSQPAGPITLQDPASGRDVRVQPGAPALHLVFFAQWCPPCRDEIAALGEFQARWGERGYRLVIVGVQARQTGDKLARFAADNETPGEMLFDARGAAQAAYKADRLPTHVVLDANGREVARSGSFDDTVRGAVEGLVGSGRHGDGGRP